MLEKLLMPRVLLRKEERLFYQFLLGKDRRKDFPLLLHGSGDSSNVLRLVELEEGFWPRFDHFPVHEFSIVIEQHTIELFNVARTTPVLNEGERACVVSNETPNGLGQMMHAGTLFAIPDRNTIDQYACTNEFCQFRTNEFSRGQAKRRSSKARFGRNFCRRFYGHCELVRGHVRAQQGNRFASNWVKRANVLELAWGAVNRMTPEFPFHGRERVL